MATKTNKAPSLASLHIAALGRFEERDAVVQLGWNASQITKDALEEVAWELGYEDPRSFDRLFSDLAPLAKALGADVRASFDRGTKAAQ